MTTLLTWTVGAGLLWLLFWLSVWLTAEAHCQRQAVRDRGGWLHAPIIDAIFFIGSWLFIMWLDGIIIVAAAIAAFEWVMQ